MVAMVQETLGKGGCALGGDGEGVECGDLDFDARVGVPVVELVVVLVEDGGDRGAVAVLGFAHKDGADFGEEAMGAVKEVDLGALDVDLDEAGWWGLFEEPVEGDAEAWWVSRVPPA